MKSQVTLTVDLWQAGRIVLAVLLLWAAVSKLANPTEFLGTLYAYELGLPRAVSQLAAVALPWFELLCGVLLLLGVWLESVLVSVAGLFGVFMVATGQAWLRGLKISCGCFDLKLIGLKSNFPDVAAFLESPLFAFVRNLLLLAVAVALLRRRLLEAGLGGDGAVSSTPAGPARPRAAGVAR